MSNNKNIEVNIIMDLSSKTEQLLENKIAVTVIKDVEVLPLSNKNKHTYFMNQVLKYVQDSNFVKEDDEMFYKCDISQLKSISNQKNIKLGLDQALA